MTTQQAPPRHNVAVVGFGVSPGKTPYLTCEPWFRTTQPFNIYLNDEEHRKMKFSVGDLITVERGGKGKDRQGNVKTGTADFDYYWNFVGRSGSQPPLTEQQSQAAGASSASQTNAPQQTSRTASSPATTTQGSVAQGAPLAPAPVQENQYRTPSQNMRTDAVKFAMECMEKGISIKATLEMAELIESYIATGTAPAQEEK